MQVSLPAVHGQDRAVRSQGGRLLVVLLDGRREPARARAGRRRPPTDQYAALPSQLASHILQPKVINSSRETERLSGCKTVSETYRTMRKRMSVLRLRNLKIHLVNQSPSVDYTHDSLDSCATLLVRSPAYSLANRIPERTFDWSNSRSFHSSSDERSFAHGWIDMEGIGIRLVPYGRGQRVPVVMQFIPL